MISAAEYDPSSASNIDFRSAHLKQSEPGNSSRPASINDKLSPLNWTGLQTYERAFERESTHQHNREPPDIHIQASTSRGAYWQERKSQDMRSDGHTFQVTIRVVRRDREPETEPDSISTFPALPLPQRTHSRLRNLDLSSCSAPGPSVPTAPVPAWALAAAFFASLRAFRSACNAS